MLAKRLVFRMAFSFLDACFGCLVSLVDFQGGGFLGKLHNICQGEYEGVKGVIAVVRRKGCVSYEWVIFS